MSTKSRVPFFTLLRIHRVVIIAATVCAIGVWSQPGAAQDIDADAAAAFEKMIKTYRKRPALGVKTTVSIELTKDGMTSDGKEMQAEFLFGRDRRALISLRGYQCLLTNGELIGIHEGNDDSYYRGPDDDSPYYALFTVFLDMPFPHLAIYLGEDSMEDLYMQIHPIAPSIVPTNVSDVEVDGQTMRQLTLTSDNAALDIILDPQTQLIQSAVMEVTGGPLVQPGVTMTYTHEFEYDTFENAAPDERFVIDTKGRQRVTMLATLQPPPAAPDPMNPGREPGRPGGDALVGKPAPEFTLATLDGDAVDLGELRGQIVVLDFWATWCGPCVKGLPLLHEVATWARDQQLPVKVFAINTYEGATLRNDTPDGRRELAEKFWTAKKFTLPVLMDYTDETAASYGVSGIPTTVVIRADGIVHTSHSGLSPNFVEQLKADIEAALEAVEEAP